MNSTSPANRAAYDAGLALLPATRRVDLDRLARAAGATEARLASEDEMKGLFPDVEVGAVPPFGALWNMPVFCDESLRLHERIAFHAGSHREALRMGYTDFERLTAPVVADFTEGRLDAPGNAVPVHGPPGQRLEDEELERALEEAGLTGEHGYGPGWMVVFTRPVYGRMTYPDAQREGRFRKTTRTPASAA